MAHSNYDLKKIEKKLKNHMDHDRMVHTRGVMYTAACLGMAHGCDLEKCQTAGLLHDCAKCMPDQKKLKLCIKNGIAMSDYEMRHPFILHAKLGAWIAKKKYRIQDREILDAITWHTTGKAAMTELDKIIYIADYIEPGRTKAPRLDQVREKSFYDLDEAMYMILSDTLQYLKNGGKEIDPATESAFAYYCNLHNQK
ncbi:MAG: bis(5'-nucleosyl)-tetraphosphatase (symmetrical) YqeK [Ruminococcus sp.]|jgi:predicted HD superfamily hydrolase involved in NAD metabolism